MCVCLLGTLYKIPSSVWTSGCMSLLYEQCVDHVALGFPGSGGEEERGPPCGVWPTLQPRGAVGSQHVEVGWLCGQPQVCGLYPTLSASCNRVSVGLAEDTP